MNSQPLILSIGQHLRQHHHTLSVAESLTCGHLQAIIGGISGASTFFKGGITAYYQDIKTQLLTVDPDEAQATNCVSQLIANQMAMGTCKLFETTYGISTTGYAEPTDTITTPYAYYTIYSSSQHAIIASGKILGDPTYTRHDMQLHVVNEVLTQFSHILTL